MSQTEPSWYLYLLLCADDSLYTGVTRDLKRRLHEHNHTRRGARYTRGRRPVRVVYCETAPSRAAACRREYAIKQLTPQQKLALLHDSTAADLIADLLAHHDNHPINLG